MSTLTTSGRFKQFLTVAEAACLWAGVPLEQLVGAAYLSPGVPMILGRPDVSERAEALMDACTYSSIQYLPTFMSEDGPEILERRIIRRNDLVTWLRESFTGQDAKLGGGASPTPKAVPAEFVKLLTFREMLERVGISKAQVYRLLHAKVFPQPDFTNPNRWRLSTITDYIEQNQKPSDA